MSARATVTYSKLLPYTKHAGSMQAVYLPAVPLAQERFTPPAALNSSTTILKSELADWVILFLVMTGTWIKDPHTNSLPLWACV